MEGFRADPVKWCSRKKTIVESLPLSTSDCAELGDGLATSAGAWAAGLVCGCCELTGSTAKSPITRVVATWVRMGSPMYFLTALTIIIGAASRSGPFAIRRVQLNNKHTRTLIFNIRPTGTICAMQIKSQHPRTKILGVTELKGRISSKYSVPMSF